MMLAAIAISIAIMTMAAYCVLLLFGCFALLSAIETPT